MRPSTMLPSRRATLAAGFAVALTRPAGAQALWPTRSVKVVVPWPPGGAADLVGRIYSDALARSTGQAFVVDNRSGATGTIGQMAVLQSPADGYTLLHDSTPIAVTPALFPNLSYSAAKEFVPIFQTMSVPQLVLVNPSLPVSTVPELIALIKALNGDFAAGSSGVGSLQHLVLELFVRAAGVKVNHVPYRGGAPATTDLIAGQIQLYFGNVNSTVSYVRDGALKALAHTGAGSLNSLPGLPPLSGTLPGFVTAEWNGVFLRNGTPGEVVARLSALLNGIVVDPGVAEALRKADLTAKPNSPGQFAEFFQAESRRWQAFVKQAGIRLE